MYIYSALYIVIQHSIVHLRPAPTGPHRSTPYIRTSNNSNNNSSNNNSSNSNNSNNNSNNNNNARSSSKHAVRCT